ncbi:uncharacterized protein [Asterias amurensis]|uniref:uncharacterized protein n=1 Tax=Asterias amurensis TaxID=7602 RepID=UPI003AB2038D
MYIIVVHRTCLTNCVVKKVPLNNGNALLETVSGQTSIHGLDTFNKLEMEESSTIISHQTQKGDDVNGQPLHQPGRNCLRSPHDVSTSNKGGHKNIQPEGVSQAVCIMEEIMNPCQSSCVKTETLPLHSTNEETRITEVSPLPWFTNYDKVEQAVQDYEIETTSKFLIGNPDRDFGKSFDEIKHSHHIHLNGGGFDNEISPKLLLDGIPYIMMGNKKLTCHHGKPHPNSVKKTKSKRRLCTQASKKVGCPCHITIRHVMLLPDFKFDVSKLTEHRRRELSKHIKSTMKEKGVTTESRFYIEFPDVDSHRNHPLGEAAGVKQPIDKRVNEKMLQLISNGMKSIPLIEQSIKEFVKEELFQDSPCPPHSNRRFFPTQKDIANRIFKVSASSISSKLKIDKLEELVYGLLEERANNGFVFFRSSVGTDDSTLEWSDKTQECSTINQKHHKINMDSTKDQRFDSSTEGLLFVYQTHSQRQLLARYGSELTFLDAAHRAADYAVPLYFLLVHTNCDYQIAAMIVMERESASDLGEALAVIKKDNPSWRPQQFVVDASNEEIQTVEKVFPECRVFISDIRREQAWERWLSNPKHGILNYQQLLCKMTAVATARTIDSYQEAMDKLKEVSSKAKLKLMRAWFREKWLSNIQRWAYVFRQQRQMLPLIMNNGIEDQREAMSYNFITSNRSYPLHNLLSLLVNTILPDLYARYVEVNTEWSTSTNTGVPPLLYNRPKPFIDHCQQRIKAKTLTKQQSPSELFHSPDHPNDGNVVDLSIPSCSCQDFTRSGYLCEHLLECITNKNEMLWERLPSSYLFSPFLTVDEGAVVGGGEQVFGAVDNDEEEECDNTTSGLSPEEEATSNLEAILAAVEAQTSCTTSHYDSPLQASTTPTIDEDTSYNQEAARCQFIAKQLLDLTQTITDREVLSAALIHMEASLATLNQAIPPGKLNMTDQHASTNLPIHVNRGRHNDDEYESPLKKPRLLDDAVEHDELVLLGNQVVDSEISICGNEIVEGYEVCSESLDIQESIVTETIDLQHGAVFILDPSGVMRNLKLPAKNT